MIALVSIEDEEQHYLEGYNDARNFYAAALDALKAEVERLKAGGCARDQSTTQFCAEAVALQAENARLRAALRLAIDAIDFWTADLQKLRAALGEKE